MELLSELHSTARETFNLLPLDASQELENDPQEEQLTSALEKDVCSRTLFNMK